MKKLILVFIIIIFSACAAQANNPEKDNIYNEAMNIIFEIGCNLQDNEYVNNEFIKFRAIICDYCNYFSSIEEKQDFSGKIVTNVALGITRQNVDYFNQALIILQLTHNRYASISLLYCPYNELHLS